MNRLASVSLRDPAMMVATVCGIGLLPKAPGTWGSLAALPLAWLLYGLAGPMAVALAVVLVFFAGWWAAAALARRGGDHDPGYIVIDEVAGQLVVLAVIPPDALLYAIAFALFRLFDITKPAFIGWADREIKGGLGVMLDDLLAGALGALVIYAAMRLWSF